MLHVFLTLLVVFQVQAADLNEALFEAARAGDATQIAAALDKGADVNARARYDMTALAFAADKGHLDAVKLLVARGANVNTQDTFYRFRPIDMALANSHAAVAALLLESGSPGADRALTLGIQTSNVALVRAAVSSKSDVTRPAIVGALQQAERIKQPDIVAVLTAALAARPAPPEPPPVTVDAATLARYAGTYRNAVNGMSLVVTVRDGALFAQATGQPAFELAATTPTSFRAVSIPNVTLAFQAGAGPSGLLTMRQGPSTLLMPRVTEAAAAASAGTATPPAGNAAPPAASATTSPSAPAAVAATRTAPRNWPSFRGEAGGGNGDGQGIVTEWDIATGSNIKWKTPIPGISNASPIVWGDRVFVVTAVSKGGDTSFRTGLYGDVAPVNDLSPHEWKIYSLEKSTGKVLWERTAFAGAPKVKRHTKATQANATPVTDGRHVAALFGSVGLLVTWDMTGKELWRADTGVLDSGWFLDPTYQWGHSASPVIYRNSVILQADMQKGSYLAAWDLDTGKQLWKTPRTDEISTWGTPAIVRTADGRDELVTNGTKIRGYDPATGALRWTLGPNSEITVGTPVAGHGLVFVTGGYPPVRPIFAIRPGASGDISLPKGSTSSAAMAWSNSTEGTYIPTPLVYGDRLITMNSNGIISGYDARTGQRVFRGRVGAGGAFSASPVVADGRLYIASEDGEIHVVSATPELTPIAKMDMKEVIMATPAMSDGLLIVRTMDHVYGIGR